MNKSVPAIFQQLSDIVSPLIGYQIGAEHIHSDDPGYYYYIQNLEPGRPLIMAHYRGPFMMVLPKNDYQNLEKGIVMADDYVAESYFNYGYYQGGGSLLSGAYWQPLEEAPGIHDTERISQYLRLVSCRVAIRSGCRISEEMCQKCVRDQTKCPPSSFCQTKAWGDEEEPEPDGRLKLYKALKKRIKDELGFEVTSLLSHDEGWEEVLIKPAFRVNTVEITLNKYFLNELLYYPEECDWDAKAQEMELIAVAGYMLDERKYRFLFNAPEDDKRQYFLDFWKDETKPWEKQTGATSGSVAVIGSRSKPKRTLMGILKCAFSSK